MANKNNNNDWRSKVNAMMTDPNFAEKMAAAVDTTRKVNIDLMNKSAEDYPALSVGQQTKQPLDLARVPEMQQEQAARATIDNDTEGYSGVVDLATKLYDEERTKRGQQALRNMQQPANAFASPIATAINRAAETNKAADISKTYEAVISNPSLQQAVRLNANKALVKALEANPSMTQEEQQELYNNTIDKQLQQMGEGIDKYLRSKNELKGGGEYVLRSAIQNSIIGKAMQTAIQSASGSEGELAYQQQALADYDANKAKWWEQGLSIAGGLVLDAPLMQGIGSAANATMGRATMWGLGKAGGKALQASTVGRIATGAAVSSGTLGGYNATSALANQLMEGRFDVGEIAASAGHGFMLGALTGGMSPWLRGVSAGMGKAGKVATMTGGLATEAGIFTASELSEMENPYDLETIAQVFGKNVAVIGGLKLSNLPKTVKEYKQWYTEGKQSNFTDADYKTMADFAKANGYAADDAFTMSADGAYSRSVADRVTGNRTLLTMTKLQGGKEQNLAIEMYNDPNVPLSLKTKIAAKMNLPAPPPVLPNGVRVEGNKAITYYTMPNGQQQVIDIKEFDRPRKARAYANEFSRTTARRNDLLQSEASVNVMMSQPMVVARLNEQAKRNGTTLADEKARMDAILQRAADGTITQEDIAYYRSIVEDDVTTTESLKKDIKDKFGVEIDDVLNKEGNFSAAEDEALTAYGSALRGIIERGNPTTERTATAAMAGIEDYVALNNLGIEQTNAILANPEQRAAIEQQTRSHYAAWLKFFDGKMGEDALAQKLGLDLNNTSDLQTFLAEQTYYKAKAADRIAYNTAEAAKQLLERGDGGVRFLDDGRVKLKGVPFAVEVDESIAARYEAAKQGSGEPLQRIANDALKDIIKQSETPAEPKEPIAEETPIVEEPMTEAEAVTQQMIDARLAEIDTDLQGIEADGVQRMTINGKPVAIVKGRIVADENGQVDKTKSSAEVAYMLLDENGRPMLNEQGKPIIEVGVKPSNVHVEDIEQWRSVDDYKASEEQRIRDNNRITDEAMRQVDEQTEVENQVPTEPKTADDLLAMCDGDKALALDVATDELAKAMQAKGKGATPAETIEINKRIRMYQQIVDRLSATEQPESASLPEVEQAETKAEPQVTEDMEFVYQQGLDENHDGMEPMKMADGRYKWVGLQRGELTATMGERDVELLDNLAKKLGVAVIPINVKDSAVNGYYKDGNIYVNTNRGADWTMRWVAGHELLHDVAKKSPEAYDAYKQAVLDMWGEDYVDNQVKQIIEDYKASGKQIDREQALTELVNDFGGDLFSSRDGLKILENILKTESGKGNTGFIDTIKKWWDNIKEFFGMSPYANEVERKLADAYKSAMENVDYQARQEQVVKDMDDAFFGESTEVATPKQVDSELRETKDYTPTKMPRGIAIGNKESKDYSVKQIMRGVGIDAQTDGDNVWFERDGKKFDKYNPMTIEESKSGILKNMVDQCMELGLMDEAKAEDVYKMYTGIVNKIIEKADGSFADLSNQYLWLGETVYKVVHSNSDKQYKRSLDVTLVCKKNEAVIRGISELQRRQGFGVTPSQIMQLYYSTLDKGFQVPCPVCYVFSRYIQNGQYISNLIYGHNKFDKDKYFKNPAKMSAKKKAEAEQYWFDRYNEALAWEEANKKLIADAKSVLSWATKEMDMLMLDAAKGNLDKAKRNEYKERAKKLDSWYRAALDLVAQSDMSGYIKSVIANPIVKDKKVVGMAMREDAGQKMTQEVEEAILDYRKVALAKTKYPHISRYIASKGSAAGKGFNFEGDNPMGDILQQLSTDSKNYFQEAINATSEKERNKLMKSAKDRTMAAAKYAAQQSLRGGVRQWSWSDNIEALAPDVALNAMQIGMLGGAMQTYSKQLEGIEMMAAMGAYVNGSLMGKGMGYQKVSENYSESPKWQDPNTGSWYTLAFDDVVGVQPRSLNGKLGLFALNQMYDKAGNILVGMNDIHIRTAMADPRIFFIIPWHASGMSDHILKQMNSMLKLDMAGFKASDYTKHQEEKMYKGESETDNAEEGNSGKVPESTTALWRSHDYSDRFVNNDGTKANIAIEDGTLSADQLHYRELRDAIFMHSNAESAKDTDKAFWAEHQDWLAEIKNDIFLNQAYESVTNGPGRFGVAMTKDDCGFIYPYEYWDKASTFDNADINGQRYVEYCRRLGVKPKFSGVDGGSASEYGNFVDDAGYWKLLIDRRMYDRNGNYQDLTPVDASGFKADFIDQDKTSARFPVTVVADKEQTSNIVDDVQYNELKTYKKKKLKVDYKILPETAIKNAAEALMQYNQAKQLVSMTKTGKVSVKTQKELYELELERLANEEALADIENDDFMDNEGAEMSIVRDRNKIDELEGEELVPMYRTFQVLDGRLYPPMATIQAGKKVHSIAEGDWWKSDENPDLALVKIKGTRDKFYSKDDDRISKKDGQWVITIDGEDKPLSMNGKSLSYYFNLKKGEKGDVATDDLEAAYNPYIHTSKSALNDQFRGAYLRPNLVLVEVLVPKSEIDGTNRYKADYAKDGIGFVPWNEGQVIKQAVAAGHPGRDVALSRYAKIGRVFTNAEWADRIDEELAPYKDKITLPFITFPPEVLRGLANKGYKIEPPTSKKAQPYYEKWLKGEQSTDPNGSGKPIDAEFSIKADKELEKKSLVGVHNLTEDNLRYALNLGGLANPSTAVINKDIMGLEGFGDISLIMPKSLVAKSSGKNAGTFAGDAYTPRFPRGSVVKYMTKDGEKAVAKDYPGKDKFSQDFRSAIYSLGDEYGGVTPTLYYMYKLENGGADIIKTEAPKFKSDKHKRIVEKFGQKEWYELSDAEKQELFDFRKEEMQEMLKNADKGLVSKRMSNFANYPVDDVAHDKWRTLQAEYKKLQNAGEIDYAATYRNAQDDVALAGEQADFNKWLSQISAKYGIEDRIFRGYTPSGNRKYAPLTLANLSKIMKEQGRAGEESFMSKSVYSLRAKMLPAFKTLESIRKNKDKITDEETYNKRREEISSEYNDLIFEIVKLPNVEYDDAHYVLEDALTKGFAYAEKTANTKFDDAVKARIAAFGKLLTEAPSKYFETKFERPVMFDEFVAAVVPKDINPELRKALADKGLAIEEYERGSEESRLEAVRRASDRDDVQFSIKGGKSGLKGVNSDTYKRIIELADTYDKEATENENNPEWKDNYNDYEKQVEPLAKTLTDEALIELYIELKKRQDGLDMWIVDILEGREAMSMRKRADEQAESNERALSKVKVELDALKEAVKSGNKSTIKRTKEALTEAVIKHGLGHKYMREQIALLKQIKRTDANYARNKAAADAMESAVASVEAELNNAIEKAGFEDVSLSFSNDYAFWLSAKQGSKFREAVEGLDNNERWFAEVDGRTGGLPSDLPQLTMNNIDEYVARVKDTLAPGVTIENPKGSIERVDKMAKKEKAEYYQHGQIEQGREEYEAKEQWRKDNAGAIASSFFAERRADKAAEVERLKKKISELKADNTKAVSEDKAKVREIADEMHAYIKKNIPTENQGDMTRQQFESVLKQLEKAVTKQELEKPMQMVEYIGANVARRALTRQMRDFVKNGFRALTPKGLAKPKTVDGVTSRVLGLVKTLYQSMNKNAFGSDLYKLRMQVREEKAKLEQFNADNGGKYQDVVDKVNEILAKTGVDRYEELYKYFDEKQAAGGVDGDVLGYIGRMLPLLDSIELTKDQQKQAKADSAIVTKEDLDQLRTSLEEKRDKGIMSEEDKAVLDNMPLYEAMLSLHQQQLNIDGPGASSLAMQMKAKVGEIKEYGKKLDELDNKNSKTAIAYKTRIKEANNELQELFAARIVDQKAVNANVGELLDNLKEIRDTGKSKLQEWSKAKQERATRLVKMANESFGKDAKGYWSEVDKRGKLKKDFINWANNLRLSVLMSPAMSFEYMLGVMDPRYYTNNSPIYKQFIKSSEGLIKANDNFFEGTESYNMAVNEAVERFINRNAMTNLKEYFRRGDRFATAIIPFEVKVNKNGADEYIPKEEMMTRGQAAKIYAWSRMADGMAKLKAHGVTDNTLTKVKEFIGEDYMNFIDWVEDEFFPRLRRERYNPVYKQMYGISMAENDHYFPFLIYQKDVRTEQELEVSNNDTLGGGVVGNLVERKRNNARLDFTAESQDIFDMITDYGRKMEEWAAYAQVREDLKKVINDKQFKQHCDELGTHYYKYFLEAAQVASRLSRDMAMTQHTQSGWAKAQKTIASAAISLRVSTALKQLLSAPAFMVYSLDPAFHHELIKTVQPIDVESAIRGLWKLAEGDMGEAKKLLLSENWVGHYNWCVENLPSFRERVTLGGAGNPILEEKGFFKFADDIQSVGMLPNRLVDAFTCSVGAKAIYEYAFKKYKKNYNEKTAHNMAVTDAEIAFNSSQQSSNPVFLAPMQVSKQFLLRGMMNYKNSPIGYYRNAMKASIDMYRATKAIFGQPKFTINGEVYGFENDGKNPFAMAAESGARASMFWLFLNLIWNFGTVGVAGLSYTMLNGSKNDDGNMLYTDEEIKKALGNDMGWALFNASNQGIPWVSGFSSAAQTGQDYTPSILFSEMNNYVEQINKDGFMSMATAQIFTDLLLKNAAGVDPEVWGQIYRGAQGIMEDRPMRIEDFMNLIASPRSAISGITKQRVGEYDRLRDYVNDRIESNRQLGVDERMTFGKKLTGMRELSKKSLGMYVDEYLADKIPGYREFANKPTEMEKEEEVANSNTLNAASSLYETIVRKEEEKDEKKNKIKDPEIKSTARLLTTAANVIHRLCEVNDFETAERIANEMERIIKRDYNPNGKTIEERLKNVDVWDSTGTTEQPSADGYNTAFERAIDGGFASYLRRGKD